MLCARLAPGGSGSPRPTRSMSAVRNANAAAWTASAGPAARPPNAKAVVSAAAASENPNHAIAEGPSPRAARRYAPG